MSRTYRHIEYWVHNDILDVLNQEFFDTYPKSFYTLSDLKKHGRDGRNYTVICGPSAKTPWGYSTWDDYGRDAGTGRLSKRASSKARRRYYKKFDKELLEDEMGL